MLILFMMIQQAPKVKAITNVDVLLSKRYLTARAFPPVEMFYLPVTEDKLTKLIEFMNKNNLK